MVIIQSRYENDSILKRNEENEIIFDNSNTHSGHIRLYRKKNCDRIGA